MNRFITIDGYTIDLQSLFRAIPVACALIDREGRHVALNDALAAFSGNRAEDLIGVYVRELSEESARNIENNFIDFDSGKEVPDHEISVHERDCHVSVKPFCNDKQEVIALLVAITDITARKKTERELIEANQKLERYAQVDFLTELWNRRHFDELMQQEIARSKRSNSALSLILFDVDRFKLYNDTYGHGQGDECLKIIASAAKAAVKRHGSAVCRYGGEEFAIILPETDTAGALHVAEQVRSAVENAGVLHELNTPQVVTISLGVAGYDSVRCSERIVQCIVQCADDALYKAKREGRNRVCVFDGKG